MDLQNGLQIGLAILGGGFGIKLVDYWIERRKSRSDLAVKGKELDIGEDEAVRKELWARITGLETNVMALEKESKSQAIKEQECWDKYNELFRSNAHIHAELNFVKRIMKASGRHLSALSVDDPDEMENGKIANPKLENH